MQQVTDEAREKPINGGGGTLTPLWGTLSKEMALWRRSPLQRGIGLAAPLVLLAIAAFLFSPRGREIPIALVASSVPGPYSQQFVKTLQAKTGTPMYFEVVTTDPVEAQQLLRTQRVFAIVRLPTNFDELLAQGRPATIHFQVYNGMQDVHKNVRLSFSRSVQEFYEAALGDQLRAHAVFRKSTKNDIPRSAYLAGGILVYAFMFNGILCTGVMMAREWEYGTLEELRVAPAPGWGIVAGKMTGGLLQTAVIAAVVFVISYLFTDIHVKGSVILLSFLLLLTGLMFVGLGALLGVLAKRFYLMLPLSGISAIVFWFLCGGFQDLVAVRGTFFFAISRALPPTYAFDALHEVLRGAQVREVQLNLLVVATSALVSTVAAMVVLRRQLGR